MHLRNWLSINLLIVLTHGFSLIIVNFLDNMLFFVDYYLLMVASMVSHMPSPSIVASASSFLYHDNNYDDGYDDNNGQHDGKDSY